jgi:hypothetical protein
MRGSALPRTAEDKRMHLDTLTHLVMHAAFSHRALRDLDGHLAPDAAGGRGTWAEVFNDKQDDCRKVVLTP